MGRRRTLCPIFMRDGGHIVTAPYNGGDQKDTDVEKGLF